MYKIKIFSVGKTKEYWLDLALDEYIKRMQPVASIEFIWAKTDAQLIDLVEKETAVICLDPEGKLYDSLQFSSFLLKKLEENFSRLSIVIGGPEGLPDKLAKSYPLLSLSSLTFTHQIARLILIEQIYRAFEIAKGSSYHK